MYLCIHTFEKSYDADVLHKTSLHTAFTYVVPTLCLVQRTLHALTHLTGIPTV